MRVRLINLWELLRTSYWVIPALMCVLAIVLAILCQEIDQRVSPSPDSRLDFLYFGGPEGARAVLSTIAGSMITVAGVTFSITIVALANASTQFGPRLLRNFMKDTANQVVLGTFLATFVYCLMTLRTVRGLEDFQFVPQASVAVGFALALLSISVLIFFIHHIATSLHASTIIAGVGKELEDAVDALFPETLGESTSDESEVEDLSDPESEVEPGVIESTDLGYVVGIDEDRLMRIARDRDLVLKLLEQPGSFIFPGLPLMEVYPSAGTDREELANQLNSAVLVNSQRTPTQDIGFLFDELVEIALRALSPGVNDPQTATTCVHWLTAGFSKLSQRKIPSKYRFDEQMRLRVIASPISVSGTLDRVFGQLVHAAGDNGFVLRELLDAIEGIGKAGGSAMQPGALLQQAIRIDRATRDCVRDRWERETLREQYLQVARTLSDAQ